MSTFDLINRFLTMLLWLREFDIWNPDFKIYEIGNSV